MVILDRLVLYNSANISLGEFFVTDTAIFRERLSRAIDEVNRLESNAEINAVVERLITEVTGAEYSSVWMNEYPVLVRERTEGVRTLSMEEKRGLLYKCFVTKQPAFYNYITSEKGYVQEIDNPDSIRIKSKIAIPLISGERLIGIVTCYSSVRKIKNFTSDDLAKFKAVTPFVIDAIVKMRKKRGEEIPEENGEKENSAGIMKRHGRDIIRDIGRIESSGKEPENVREILDHTASIVHDIRTPAGNLLGFLTLLEEQIEEKRLKEYIVHAKNSAGFINDLTTSILDGLAARRMEDSSGQTAVNAMKYFSDIGEIFSARMYEKGILYTVYIDPMMPKEIVVDEMKLKRVLMNLLGNAVKFTPEGGIVEYSVEYAEEEKKFRFSVRDSGIGIPKEKQKEIFKAFVQAEETTKERYGGTGLGLSISAAYVREMGGELHLESELDEGSRFFFDLPAKTAVETPKFESIDDDRLHLTVCMGARNHPVAENLIRHFVRMGVDPEKIDVVGKRSQIPQETTHLIVFERKFSESLPRMARSSGMKLMLVEENFLSLSESGFEDVSLLSQYGACAESLYAFVSPRHPVRVLIVDDDRISTELLKTMLEEEYCVIDTAYDGKEGLALLAEALEKSRPYDLLFTDQNMPGLSGTEMVSRYRELERKKQVSAPIKTVSISGDPRKEENNGIFDFFSGKPFKKSEMTGYVRKFI